MKLPRAVFALARRVRQIPAVAHALDRPNGILLRKKLPVPRNERASAQRSRIEKREDVERKKARQYASEIGSSNGNAIVEKIVHVARLAGARASKKKVEETTPLRVGPHIELEKNARRKPARHLRLHTQWPTRAFRSSNSCTVRIEYSYVNKVLGRVATGVRNARFRTKSSARLLTCSLDGTCVVGVHALFVGRDRLRVGFAFAAIANGIYTGSVCSRVSPPHVRADLSTASS